MFEFVNGSFVYEPRQVRLVYSAKFVLRLRKDRSTSRFFLSHIRHTLSCVVLNSCLFSLHVVPLTDYFLFGEL